MKKTIIQLETLTCPSCVRRIEGTVGKLKGVLSAAVKFNASKVEVVHDEAIIDAKMIKRMIVSLGYEVLDQK